MSFKFTIRRYKKDGEIENINNAEEELDKYRKKLYVWGVLLVFSLAIYFASTRISSALIEYFTLGEKIISNLVTISICLVLISLVIRILSQNISNIILGIAIIISIIISNPIIQEKFEEFFKGIVIINEDNISNFNRNFTMFTGKKLTGSQIESVIEKVIEQNNVNKDIKIIFINEFEIDTVSQIVELKLNTEMYNKVYYEGNKYSKQDENELNILKHKIYRYKKYNVSITYNKALGFVNSIKIENAY